MKYIYKLFIGYHKKNRLEYDSVLSEVYFSREEAIEAGKNDILFFIKNRTDTETVEEFISNYDYEFRVSVINLNRKKINDLGNRWEYIKNNIPADKSKIYDFLTSVAEEVYEIYENNENGISQTKYEYDPKGQLLTQIDFDLDNNISLQIDYENIYED